MKFGVGVEGPSDRLFWDKVLHRSFPGCRFDIRNMKNRQKLIREAPILQEAFRDLGYRGGFIVLDRDDDPCITAVMDLFDSTVKTVFKSQPPSSRYLHAGVAVRELESWYLADELAIQAVIKGCDYSAPGDTGAIAKGKLKQLLRDCRGAGASFNEIGFAKEIALKFNPKRAINHSSSFKFVWERIETLCRK